MTRFFALSLLLLCFLTARSQYVFEDVINAKRFGHLQLATPYAIAKGPDGRLFVACSDKIAILDSLGNQLGVVDVEGPYDYAYSLFVDKGNNLYVGVYGKVLVYNANGEVIRSFGSLGTGPGEFYAAFSIVEDSFGNILLLDTYNSRVVVFNADGNFLYDFSGMGSQFSMAIDSEDVVYIVDFSGGEVKKFKNGAYLGLFVQTSFPDNITIDSEGNFYLHSFVTDDNFYWGPVVIKYNNHGDSLSTVSGIDQINSDDRLIYNFYQLKLVPDGLGGVYGSETSTNRIVKIHFGSGEISELVKVNHTGQTNLPGDIKTDSAGNVYVVDEINDAIQVFDYSGNYLRKIQINSIGFGSGPYPYKIDIDQDGNVFVLNSGNKVSVFNGQGEFLSDWEFSERKYGIDIVVNDSMVYILGSNNNDSDSLINVYTREGVHQRTIFDTTPDENFDSPQCMAMDYEGNFVVGKFNGRVNFFSNDGTFLRTLEGNYSSPVKAIDIEYNNLYIGRYSYIQIFNSSDSLIQVIGETNISGPEPGQFSQIEGLIVNSDRLFVSDHYNNRIQIFSSLPIPSITFQDIEVNYMAYSIRLDASSNIAEPITYKIVDGNAVTLGADQIVYLDKAGEVTIEASQAATVTHSKGTATAKLTISKGLLTLTSDNKERIYGDEDPQFTKQITGFRFDDCASEIDQMPVMTAGPTELYSTGTYFINFEGGSDDNYDFIFDPGILTIHKATLYLKPEHITRIYGDENPPLTFLYDGFKYNDDSTDIDEHPVLSTEATSTSPVGYYPIIPSSGLDRNYEIVIASDCLTVTKAPLTITIENKIKTYNSSNPELTYTYIGFKNDEDESVIDVPPVLVTDAIDGSSVGEYPIYLEEEGSDNNYEFTFQDGMLTITKANQQITFDALPSPVINTLPPFALSATSNSSLPVNYTVTNGPASYSADFLTLSGEVGTVTVEASQSGDENHNAATPVSRSFEVILDPVLGYEEARADLKIYPNPVKGDFQLTSLEGVQSFQLLNSNGLAVVQYSGISKEEHLVNVSVLPEGLYFLIAKTSSGRELIRKIMVAR